MKKKLAQIIKRLLVDSYVTPPLADLSGVVVLITGAGQGIGKQTALILLEQGATVCALDRTAITYGTTVSVPKRFLELQADVTDPESMKRAINDVIKQYGHIDVVINNAGIFTGGPLEDTSMSNFEKIVNINLKGVFLTSKLVIPHMKKHKHGFILNIGSKISHNTSVEAHRVLYAMTKYGVEGFSYALNRELKAFGIRVSCLMPGTVDTYLSTDSRNRVPIQRIGELIAMMIKFQDIDFEGVVIKTIRQTL